MNKRILIFLPLLLALTILSCNKEKTFTVRLHNISSGPVRVKVNFDQSLAAPGQNTLKLDQIIQSGQKVDIYYNKGVGIDLPTMKDNDTLLQYVVRVMNADSVESTVNFRSLNQYSEISTESKHVKTYEGKIIDQVFPE